MGSLEIINALAASRRAVQLYPPEHPTHREAVDDLVAAVTATVDVRPLVLNLRNGRLHEGSEVVPASTPPVRAFAEALESRAVESLTFHMGFGRVDATGLSEVLSLRPSPELQVQAELDERGVRAVTVSELEDTSSAEAEDRDRRREADRAIYRTALAGLKDIATALEAGTPPDPLVAHRAIAAFVERVAEDPYAMLALASMTGHGDPSRFHAASVMLHSLVLGTGLGLADRELLGLGLAGLLHDAGLFGVSPGDSASYATHPTRGAQALGAVPDDEATLVLVALEHHMGVDGSGFPEREPGHEAHPYSRIVAIADTYDKLLRPPGGSALKTDEAGAELLRRGDGGPLDPALMRAFVNLIGCIPVTTIVRLSDFSVGLVIKPGHDPLRPYLRLVLAPDGQPLTPPVDVYLAEDERAIVEILPEPLLGMRPSDYL